MLWVRTVIDLLVTASRERSLALWQRSLLLRCGMAAAAIVLACLARYLHGATDADGITLVLVAGGSLLWGAVWSHRRRSWPLLIGLGVFALVVIGYSWSIGGRSDGDVDTPSALMSIQLLLAGYLGTLMSRAVAQRAPSDSGFQS